MSQTPPTNAAVLQMAALMEAELERLKAELAVIRAGSHPQRQTLIRDRVARIDEREDALADLRLSLDGAAGPCSSD